eukprot:3079734-Pleurochrysis_carterae.AAC.1
MARAQKDKSAKKQTRARRGAQRPVRIRTHDRYACMRTNANTCLHMRMHAHTQGFPGCATQTPNLLEYIRGYMLPMA